MIEVKGSNPIDLDVHNLDITRDDIPLDDVWEGDTFLLVCCDCGLAHDAGFVRNKVTNEMMVLFARDNRSTAQHRRYKHCGLMQDKSKNWKLVRKD